MTKDIIITGLWPNGTQHYESLIEKILGYHCSVFYFVHYAKCLYAECHCAECYYAEYCLTEYHHAERHYAECHYTELHYAEYHYTELHYAECHYVECHHAGCHYSDCHSSDCHYIKLIYAECHCAEHCNAAIMLSVWVVTIRIILLRVDRQSVIDLSVVLLNGMAPS